MRRFFCNAMATFDNKHTQYTLKSALGNTLEDTEMHTEFDGLATSD